MRLDLRQDFCHAVDIGLAADEAGIGKGQRFRDQMFAAAKTDFEPDVFKRRFENIREIFRRGRADIERQARQQIVDQIGLMRAQLVALAPAEERALSMRVRVLAVGIGGARHRSVWYSRYNSRVRGSIDEIYICS